MPTHTSSDTDSADLSPVERRNALIAIANQALENEDLEAAQRAYDQLLNDFPKQPFGAIGQLKLAALRHEYDTVLHMAQELIPVCPDNPNVIQSLISVFKRHQDLTLLVQTMKLLDQHQQQTFHVLVLAFLKRLFYGASKEMIHEYFSHESCPMNPEFLIFGDSHAGALYNTSSFKHAERMYPPVFRLFGSTISGYIKEFSFHNTYLNLQKLLSTLRPSTILVSLGQTDVDIGMYYRLVVKEESLEPHSFFESMIKQYVQRLTEIETDTSVIASGVNIPTLVDHDMAVSVIGNKICLHVPESEKPRYMEQLSKSLPSYENRLQLSLLFNQLLKNECDTHGINYIDYTDEFLNSEGKVDEAYTKPYDHHYVLTAQQSRICWGKLRDTFDIPLLKKIL